MRCRMGSINRCCALFLLCPLTAAAAAAAEMCRERRGVVCFRVKLSGRPLDRARCLTASCRAVVAALQRQDGVVTNSRLPCSTAEKARALYMRLPQFAPVSGGTQASGTNTWCGAGGSWQVRTRRPCGGPVSFPVGLEGLSTGFSSPSFSTSGGQDEGSWPVHPFSAVPECLA